jgi:hypothetical protein
MVGRHCPVCPFGIRIDSMSPARFRMGQNKKPQPETTPSRFPGAAALPLARRWTARRHDLMGRYRVRHFKLRANSAAL